MTPGILAAVRAELPDHLRPLAYRDADSLAIARHFYLLACERMEKLAAEEMAQRREVA